MRGFFGAMILILASGSADVTFADDVDDFNDGVTAYRAQEYVTAFKKWLPLAERGESLAQGNVGFLYTRGYGVAIDEKMAARWLTAAAEQNNPEAQRNLALLYQDGTGVEKSQKTAAMWLNFSARQGYRHSQADLGVMYYNGLGVDQDIVKAQMWFNISLLNGDGRASSHQLRLEKKMTLLKL